ncbi:MAG: DUF2723 domain-containing protein [Polyangiaceae bacterium]|nr:DUF2723 domain-containing protein [Polyangiaceae bacterium]
MQKRLQRVEKIEWLGALIGLLFACLYLATLLPGLHEFGDITKAQFLGRFLGMTHPTGYPLYILLTAPIARLPWGDLAWRINAFSAFCGAISVYFLFRSSRRLGLSTSSSALASLLFGISQTPWSQFVIAEVYGLNAALFSIVIYLLLGWTTENRLKSFVGACFVYSLAFGNHLTMVTLLPSFVVALFVGDYRRVFRPLPLMAILLSILLGASQYAYLFWASSSDSLYLEYRVRNFDQLIEFVSGERYRSLMFAFGWQDVITQRLPLFARQFWNDLGPILLLVPLGLLQLFQSNSPGRGKSFWVLFIASLGHLLWLTEYNIPDISVYAIPLLWLLCLFLAGAFELLIQRGPVLHGITIASVCVAAYFLIPGNYPHHKKAARFEKSLARQLKRIDHDAALISALHYSHRMGYVYRLYADGLQEERNLHLAYRASPKKVAEYFRGKETLVDSHTHERLPLGLRLYVDSRGARKKWGSALRLSPSRAGLREITLRKKKKK